MSETDGVYKFLEYLDVIKDNIQIFESLVFASELIAELGITEEQAEVGNVLLEKMQREWEEEFLKVLKYGVKWIEHNQEDKK